MPNERELERRLMLVAEREAKKRSFEITSDTYTFLKPFIHDGVRRLIAEGYARDERHIKLAEDNLVRFVEEMTIESNRMGFRYYYRESAFTTVLNFLCPLWPFC